VLNPSVPFIACIACVKSLRPLYCYTEPEPELKLLLERLRLELPAQPPPKITAAQAEAATPV